MQRMIKWIPTVLLAISLIFFGLFRLLAGDTSTTPGDDAPLYLITLGSTFAALAVTSFFVLLVIKILASRKD